MGGAAECGIWRVILAAPVGTMIQDKVGNMK
jgi:hypothetical protein